jgi:hypothetical protein
MKRIPAAGAFAAVVVCVAAAAGEGGRAAAATRPAAGERPTTRPAGRSPYAQWEHGPPADEGYFPISVWLQHPKNAGRYKAAGINLYVGLWKGPTGAQLAALKKAGMPVICHQNAVGLKHRDDAIIVGWMHGDEPDNAQKRPDGKGYGPPVAPERIVAGYGRMRAADPSRPVLLNLGQGVAWDDWIGRGVRRNHPEDYPLYVKGCDIASFDIYPVVHRSAAVAGKLWYVARGVERLRKWAGPKRVVWNCIECTRISNTKVKPTPAQVRAEVWMSIIHGSRGLIYFVHQFKPRFIEAALLADKEMTAAVTKINRQVRELAPVINAPDWTGGVTIARPTGAPYPPLAYTARWKGGDCYILAVAMRDEAFDVSFALPANVGRDPTAEVLGEDRAVSMEGYILKDHFAGYGVHLYRIRGKRD